MIKDEDQKKEKNIKRLSVIALIISVIGLTIAFLAMSKIAKIDKNSSIKDARWNVHFENLTSNITGDAKINKMPELNQEKNYIGNFEISLTGSKMQTVAAAVLSSVCKVSQCWYIKPSKFDTKHFTKGVGDTRCYQIKKTNKDSMEETI